ncbi:alpha/beta fold hydrolase [Actinoplanes awajinensis]|uniref:Alpha/beta hydrolase n=1 Tax=Actinoplanes awajinensis subsp. mycoplanecinus TaxID=135947 RepID=A0A101JNP1_9ACTN|nr:alpha/beta hydrolase [Actinoplanes awajinensis]KUL29691.1 alpha/beta hydrolase [Actinoplanes awajinensis subsp. mycoplanecinus]
MTNSPDLSGGISTGYRSVPTRTLTSGGVTWAYRVLGAPGDVPLILLPHLAAVLDNWDPALVDGLAAGRQVIAFDNRGVGATTGATPTSVEAMARDAVTFIRALGHQQVDLLGLSLGGMVAQVIAHREAHLVSKVILAGTGPAGGPGITKVTRLSNLALLRGALARQDPKKYLFFTRTTNGRRAADEFLARLHERTQDRDTPVSLSTYRAQLRAVSRWGRARAADLSLIHQPTLVANGEHDVMVPTANSVDLAARLPNSELVLYPDAGHGGIFQHHAAFTTTASAFLAR